LVALDTAEIEVAALAGVAGPARATAAIVAALLIGAIAEAGGGVDALAVDIADLARGAGSALAAALDALAGVLVRVDAAVVGDEVQEGLDAAGLAKPGAVNLDEGVEEAIGEGVAVAEAVDGDTAAGGAGVAAGGEREAAGHEEQCDEAAESMEASHGGEYSG
jgi:hypothetical protein